MQDEIAADSKSDIFVPPEHENTFTRAESKPEEVPAPEAKAEGKKPEEVEAKVEGKKTEDEPKPVKKAGVQDRIDELTKARRIAERRAELAEAKIAEMEKAAKPDPDKYEDAADHAAAVARDEGKKSAHAATKEDAEAEIAEFDKEIQTALIEDWTDAVEEVKKTIPDFEEVLSKSKSPLPKHVEDAILAYRDEAGNHLGPKLAYHLAKNTAEAVHLSRLSPLSLGRELARLELRLQSQKVPEKKIVSQAPAPIAPLSAKESAPAVDEYTAWAAKRNKESHIRR